MENKILKRKNPAKICTGERLFRLLGEAKNQHHFKYKKMHHKTFKCSNFLLFLNKVSFAGKKCKRCNFHEKSNNYLLFILQFLSLKLFFKYKWKSASPRRFWRENFSFKILFSIMHMNFKKKVVHCYSLRYYIYSAPIWSVMPKWQHFF